MQHKELLGGDGSVTLDGITLERDERQECEVWTRVMGYFRPVSQYNIGKRGEFHERTEFIEPKMADCVS